MKEIALIPAYEPDEKLITLLRELYITSVHAVVVDDGSGDNFENIFKEAEKYAVVLTHEENMGKGAALKTGLQYIKENNDNHYVVVTMDSDGQHTVTDAVKLCICASMNRDKLILGKRTFDENTPIRSRFGNAFTRLIYRISTGISVYDTQTGLRAFSDGLVDYMLQIEGQRYEYEMNVLMQSKKSNIEIKEVEIQTIYIDNNSASHFNTLRDSVRIYKEILKFSLSSLICFFLDFGLYLMFLNLTIFLGSASSVRVSNIFARIVSASVNFNLNRRFVFNSNSNVGKAIVKYIALALFILVCNTGLLTFLVEVISVNKALAKIITELSLFSISMAIQKMVIFKKDNKFIKGAIQ